MKAATPSARPAVYIFRHVTVPTVRASWQPRPRRHAPCTLSVPNGSLPCALLGSPGQDGAHRVHFPSRTGACRVHKRAICVHGRGSPVPISAHGGGLVCRVHFPSQTGAYRVHIRQRGARGLMVLDARPGGGLGVGLARGLAWGWRGAWRGVACPRLPHVYVLFVANRSSGALPWRHCFRELLLHQLRILYNVLWVHTHKLTWHSSGSPAVVLADIQKHVHL